MHVVALVGGALLVVVMLADAIGAMIVTRSRSARWRPSRIWNHLSWKLFSAAAERLPLPAADFVLDTYSAFSLLGLLAVWLAGEAVGWGFVYWGLRANVNGAGDLGSLMYYAGASLVAAQFGTVQGSLERALSLVETVAGLGTIALLISYLPALYGAYSRREARLLTLDHPSGGRLIPMQLIQLGSDGTDLERYHRFCAEWELWTAELLESHTSFPTLALFRSRHRGQSWITALGAVVDSATFACAALRGEDRREPYLLHRRGRRAVLDIADRLHVKRRTDSVSWLSRENHDRAWLGLQQLGLDMVPVDESWRRLQELYLPYGARLQDLIDYLLAPHGFWGHSAEATVAEEVAQAEAAAHERERRKRQAKVAS